MPLNLDKYSELTFVVGTAGIAENMTTVRPLQPFSECVISFLNDLSRKVMRSGREFSDVANFGLWCRRGALLNEKSKYDDLSRRLGRGVVFHSTPSNVPVNFAFSFAAGLLTGNANIVRLPAKKFEQVTIICDATNELLNENYKDMALYICMVKYPPLGEISDAFSSICDTRVVWGGDGTINEMRQSPLQPRANEIMFADRHSIAVINADEYLNADNKDAVAQNFYNDTFFSDQNACTTPRIIVWLGDEKEKAKEIFWDKAHALVKEKYTIAPVHVVGKLTAFYRVASHKPVNLITNEDQLITRVKVDTLDENLMDFKYNSGFFFEYDAKELSDILPLCSQRCQTLTYFGLTEKELETFVTEYRPRGVDRAVPMGKSMDFTLVWDGYDLIRSLSRKISII